MNFCVRQNSEIIEDFSSVRHKCFFCEMETKDFVSDSEIYPFCYKNGRLFCENVELETILADTEKQCSYNISGYQQTITFKEPLTPVYVYSLSGVYRNVKDYVDAMQLSNLTGKIGYAVKANPNIHLIQKMKQFGVDMLITVSGYEILTGIKAGFTPDNIILNGNGKQRWEIKLAIEHGVMMNVDSLFDARRIVKTLEDMKSDKEVNVLLRIRPNKPNDEQVQLTVHEYVNTAERSKFGFPFSELDEILDALGSNERIIISGIHCHFGSGINNPKIYEWLGKTVADIRDELSKRGVLIKVINVGGGIGIDYYEKPFGFNQRLNDDPTVKDYSSFENVKDVQKVPSISSFLSALSRTIPKNVDVIIEPGRSLIGKAGILVSNVLGTKLSNGRNIMVIDGSMNEVIRPCLYGAHHHIFPIKIKPTKKWDTYDVVGPICESSDFLGKNIPMQSGTNFVAVMDVGAYCSSMASVYNLKPRAAEILVNGCSWTYIRSRDTFEDMVNKWPPT